MTFPNRYYEIHEFNLVCESTIKHSCGSETVCPPCILRVVCRRGARRLQQPFSRGALALSPLSKNQQVVGISNRGSDLNHNIIRFRFEVEPVPQVGEPSSRVG